MGQAKRVLLVEDEYLIADDMVHELRLLGVEVVGPVPTVAEALRRVEADGNFDAAMLDVNLRGETVFPVADLLLARGVPVFFTTGYDAEAIPERYAHIARFGKPLTRNMLRRAVDGALDVRFGETDRA